MSSEFDNATALEPDGGTPGVYRGNVPDGWQQGRGAFGGVVVAILARAMTTLEASRERPLRSLTSDLAAPLLAGALRVEVSTLRRGSSMTFAEARLLQKGTVVARASAAFGKGRAPAAPALSPELPQMPPWKDIAVALVAPPVGPVFAQHYEYRPTGPTPFTRGSEAATAGWIREKTTPDVLDEAAIAGLLDAWWPTTFSVDETPRAVATVGYTMQLLCDPRTLSPSEPLFYRGFGVASSESFFVEMRELWALDRLVAMNQQTFAVLG